MIRSDIMGFILGAPVGMFVGMITMMAVTLKAESEKSEVEPLHGGGDGRVDDLCVLGDGSGGDESLGHGSSGSDHDHPPCPL